MCNISALLIGTLGTGVVSIIFLLESTERTGVVSIIFLLESTATTGVVSIFLFESTERTGFLFIGAAALLAIGTISFAPFPFVFL